MKSTEKAPMAVDETALLAFIVDAFRAIASQDEVVLAPFVAPEGNLDLALALWGWPAVRMLTDWGGTTPGLRLVAVRPDGEGLEVEVAWGRGPSGLESGAREPGGTTLWLDLADDGWQLFDAVPETEQAFNRLFAPYATGKQVLPWRDAAPSPGEKKLRQSIAARKLDLVTQLQLVQMWRLLAPQAADPAQPEAWAAAAEWLFIVSQGRDLGIKQVADLYGANKSVVKARSEALQAFLAAQLPPG